MNGVQPYVDAFRPPSGEPAWLAAQRRAAMQRFAELGFPTLHDEDWRFTNVAAIAKLPFKLAAAAGVNGHANLAELVFSKLPGARLVFINGHYSADQ